MIVQIDTNSSIPIYLQIYENVVSAIARGVLSDGEALPSARKLAKDLGINYHTVNKAYNLLEMEGFVKVSGKKTIVIAKADHGLISEFMDKWNMVVTSIIREAMAKGLEREQIEKMFSELLETLFKERKN